MLGTGGDSIMTDADATLVSRYERDHPDEAGELWSRLVNGPALLSANEVVMIYRESVLRRLGSAL
jgi:hypothetical protein